MGKKAYPKVEVSDAILVVLSRLGYGSASDGSEPSRE
jgi:hypothetical protein